MPTWWTSSPTSRPASPPSHRGAPAGRGEGGARARLRRHRERRVAGRTALERREDVLRFGALAGASGYVPEERRETGRVAGESLRLSSLRQRLGIAPLPGER